VDEREENELDWLVLKRENGESVALYRDSNSELAIAKLNVKGRVLGKKLAQLFQVFCKKGCVEEFDVAPIGARNGNNLVIYALIGELDDYSPVLYRDRKLHIEKTYSMVYLLVLVDSEFNYINHVELDSDKYNLRSHKMCANISRLLFVDGNGTCISFDSQLGLVGDSSVQKLRAHLVGVEILDILMSEKHLFVLIETNEQTRLTIFTLDTFDLVQTMDTQADCMKLASDLWLVLFDRKSGLLQKYRQSGRFELEDELTIDIGKMDCTTDHNEDDPIRLSKDTTPFVNVYNSKEARCLFLSD
jgi:hypothetical protein